MGKGRREKGSEGGGAPAWMVTYGDLMGLLLTFFILLVSFSSLDKNKITEAMGSIQGALGVMPTRQAIMQLQQSVIRRQQRIPKSIERVARELRQRLQVLGMEQGVDIKFEGDGGLDISLPNHVLFDFGQATLKPEAYEILNQLAASLGDIPGKFVEIRGHTDNVPVGPNSPYADNYDLSYQRAKNVMLQLTGPGGIPQRETEVIACGPSQPIADNATEEGRQENRRVQIKVRGDFSDDSAKELEQMIDRLKQLPSARQSSNEQGFQ
ncbi:MAG: membrane protein [Candidatus Hydrogenedentota bacterium]